jgi:hypothetical protein
MQQRPKMLGEEKAVIQPPLYEAVVSTEDGKLKTYYSGPEERARAYIAEHPLRRGDEWLLFRLTVIVQRETLPTVTRRAQ